MFDQLIIILAEKIGKYVSSIVSKDLQFKTFQISSLQLESGDTIVLRTKLHLSEEACLRLTESMTRHFPGHKAIVLEEDIDIAVLKNDKTE